MSDFTELGLEKFLPLRNGGIRTIVVVLFYVMGLLFMTGAIAFTVIRLQGNPYNNLVTLGTLFSGLGWAALYCIYFGYGLTDGASLWWFPDYLQRNVRNKHVLRCELVGDRWDCTLQTGWEIDATRRTLLIPLGGWHNANCRLHIPRYEDGDQPTNTTWRFRVAGISAIWVSLYFLDAWKNRICLSFTNVLRLIQESTPTLHVTGADTMIHHLLSMNAIYRRNWESVQEMYELAKSRHTAAIDGALAAIRGLRSATRFKSTEAGMIRTGLAETFIQLVDDNDPRIGELLNNLTM